MIKPKKKICKSCKQERFIWSKGMCQQCASKQAVQDARRRAYPLVGGRFSTQGHKNPTKGIKSPKKPMSHRTVKRQRQEKEYMEMKKRVQQQPNCFFCGKPVRNGDDHHLKGRDGDLLTDEKYQIHCHRQCHNDYHFRSIWDWEWREGFLERIKQLDESLWRKEVMKMYKT